MASVGLSRNARLMRLAIHSRIILPTNPYARPVSQRRRHLSVRISVSRPRLQQRENEASSAISTGDRRAGSHTMQSYLFIGVTDSKTYARESLSVGDAFIDIFRHESLTPEEVLARLVEHYKA